MIALSPLDDIVDELVEAQEKVAAFHPDRYSSADRRALLSASALAMTFEPGDAVFTQLLGDSRDGYLMRVFYRADGRGGRAKGTLQNTSPTVALAFGFRQVASREAMVVPHTDVDGDDPESWLVGEIERILYFERGSLRPVYLQGSARAPKVPESEK